jgi:hypothetical protein
MRFEGQAGRCIEDLVLDTCYTAGHEDMHSVGVATTLSAAKGVREDHDGTPVHAKLVCVHAHTIHAANLAPTRVKRHRQL